MKKTYQLRALQLNLFLSLTLTVTISNAQDKIKAYVQGNTTAVRTINPDSTDYTDLQAIGEAIGDARIVMLGEQDHGDAPAFLAKTRLIKYLHEQKGFNVLAFESDFFGLNYGWDKIGKDQKTIDSLIKRNISALWTYCTACQPLFQDYIPSTFRTTNPLQLTGFDNQAALPFLMRTLDSQMQALQLPVTTLPNYTTEIQPLLQDWYNHLEDTTLNNKYLGQLAIIKDQLTNKLSANDFWVQVIDNLIALNQQFINTKADYWKSLNTRDHQMAVNLKWLSQVKYPAEKIIVWAHNYHVSKYSGHYPERFLNQANTMGSVLTSDSNLMKQTYIIGFTSYEGTAGRIFAKKTHEVSKPKPNSFENWVNGSYDFAFVDFKKFNQMFPNESNDFYMSGATKGGGWFHKNAKAQWNKVFDGVFFIRHMYPCEKIAAIADRPGAPAVMSISQQPQSSLSSKSH